MPTSPPAIFTPPTATPAAIGAVFAPGFVPAMPPAPPAALPTATPGNVGTVFAPGFVPGMPPAPPAALPTATPGNVGTVFAPGFVPAMPPAPPAALKTATPGNVGTVFAPGFVPGGIPAITEPSFGVNGALVVGGTLVPALAGLMPKVLNPESSAFSNGGPEWSSTGGLVPPSTGTWGKAFKWLLKTPAAATISAILPAAGYVANHNPALASMLSYWNGSSWVNYYLWDLNDGNPGTARWCLLGGDTTDRGGVVLPTGSLIVIGGMLAGIQEAEFIGGLGAAWQADPTTAYQWRFMLYDSGSLVGQWFSDAVSVTSGTWTLLSGPATGLPSFSLPTVPAITP